MSSTLWMHWEATGVRHAFQSTMSEFEALTEGHESVKRPLRCYDNAHRLVTGRSAEQLGWQLRCWSLAILQISHYECQASCGA